MTKTRPDGDAFGDRMKSYEARESERRFMPLAPVYARIDGRGFSSFTKGMERPFDRIMSDLMVRTTEALVGQTHARIGYTQSDEISLVWLAERSDSAIFFDHRVAKMTSVLASLATVVFMHALLQSELQRLAQRLPHFDARVFQLPNRAEAANVFLWREQDATKNAISMAASSVYSHRELDGKTSAQRQEMLFAKGINFNDYPAFFKRGTFVRREIEWRHFAAGEWARIPEAHRPPLDQPIQRSRMVRLDMPRFGSVVNREAVIFDGAAPQIAAEVQGCVSPVGSEPFVGSAIDPIPCGGMKPKEHADDQP